MPNVINYIWIFLLIIYIISPFDAVPHFFDDILASIALFYYLYKNSKQKQQQYQRHGQQSQSNSYRAPGKGGTLTMEEAYRILGVDSSANIEEVSKAYKEKMRMSHPDKVSHLSEELQEKAKELTLRLNEAYELVKKYKE